MYEPREDSDFLVRFVKTHARGHVLDMGTGLGIQILAMLKNKKVTSAVAVDIDAASVAYVKKKTVSFDNVRVLQSDMFAQLPDEKFDVIVCNPPYLPEEKKHEDSALYGGPNGYEFTVRFLRESKEHLAKDGQIILLFSSLTNKERIDRELREQGYRSELLGELAMFFERLYVYRIWRTG